MQMRRTRLPMVPVDSSAAKMPAWTASASFRSRGESSECLDIEYMAHHDRIAVESLDDLGETPVPDEMLHGQRYRHVYIPYITRMSDQRTNLCRVWR